ncbi:MAG TPA: DUF3106 domain-containing protein, partial [Rhodanobacteraceae bacterium]|nr:DUF3106 domain-containing protein [Rhodanobacteraceae bacterium]
MRRLTLMALGLLATAVMLPGWSQQAPRASVPATAASAPLAWNDLDANAQYMLEPLHYKWNRMPPDHQRHMQRKARHWETLSPGRRDEIRQRIAHWQQMTPAERDRARANRRVYHHLRPAERSRLHSAYERFKQMPEAQRKALREQWHQLSPQQRRHWIENGAQGDLPQPLPPWPSPVQRREQTQLP